MLAVKGVFSRPGIFNKMSRIFQLQPRISFVSAWTEHYMPILHKPREAAQTIIVILIFCYLYAIFIPIGSLIVSIRIGITIRIITGIITTTGIICIRIKMGITIRITIGFTITIRITTLKRTMTFGLIVVGERSRQTHGRTHKLCCTHTTA
jgi:hypothetical protein